MSKKPNIYTAQFKAEAIKLIEQNNANVSVAARELGICMQMLSNWFNKANSGKLVGTEQYNPKLD